METADLVKVLPLFYVCLILPNLFVILRYYFLNRKKEYLALFSLILIFAVFLLTEGLSDLLCILSPYRAASFELARIQELSLVFFFIVIPYILGTNFQLTGRLKKINRFFLLMGVIIAVFMIFFAYASPELFLNRDLIMKEGILDGSKPISSGSGFAFKLRDVLLILYFVFGAFVVIRSRKDHKLNPVQLSIMTGSLIVFIFSIGDLATNLLGGLIFRVPLLRFESGITIFSFYIFYRSIIFILHRGNEAEKIQGDLEEKQKLLEFQATHRKDTGLLNREAFYNALEGYFEENRRSERVDSLIFVNIDNYYEVFESFGLDLTSLILKQMSFRIQNILFENSVLFHLENREFAIFIKSAESRGYIERFSEILRSILIQRIPVRDDFYFVNVSMGVLFLPEDGDSLQDILKNAYNTLNHAWTEPNHILFFNRDIFEKSRERIQIVNRIQNSIKRREFFFHYQPLVNRTGMVESVEALIRWNSPISVEDLISHAETSGIMPELGIHIFSVLLEDVRKMRREGVNLKVFFNLSPTQIVREGFSKNIINRLEAANLSIDDLGFEITENVMIRENSYFNANFDLLKNQGYELVLDDFGKGYSSLSYLYKFPVSKLKIDKDFLREIPEHREKTVLLKNIIALAKDLRYRIVAEGVEREEQVSFLRGEIDYYQGFYFYRPVALDDLILLRENMARPHEKLV